ncbi:hypothetical protein POJ06DRAFT_270694 [Lipomyces tetrasporus]|uniref:GCS light chain n=1 Tax=Lipomyces tetrasporus TaxID=54092 RepID=A0AAD7QMB3_9ASCO|nr:uncharacterized protein POJ06DRAFT_270694 [Lipomyces tetrasporus]KAJ8097879.1 hypothetical protein POJ06DRAFT_270694 [Lipomyces tetrasporus]
MSIILSTGNVSHARKSGTQDLVSDLKQRILLWCDEEQHTGSALSLAGDVKLEIPPNPREPLLCVDETPDRKAQVEITVKLFFPPSSTVSARAKILERALSQFKAAAPEQVRISQLVLSFPEITFSDDDGEDLDEESSTLGSSISEQDLLDIWTVAVQTAEWYNVQSVGVSEFSTARLEALIKFSKRKGLALPSINQINIRDCCVLPPSLTTLAKENGVKLLAHNDALNILPEESVRDIVALLTADELTVAEDKWSWEWLLKITGVLANRGIVCGLGWMVEFVNIGDDI